MSASYCFVPHGRCIAPRVRDSIFAAHQRPQVAAFMECADFMQPRWPSRISIEVVHDSHPCDGFLDEVIKRHQGENGASSLARC